MKQPIGVQIEGAIYATNGEKVGVNEFLDAFIEFIERNGWHFGGGGYQIDEEGNQIDPIDNIFIV